MDPEFSTWGLMVALLVLATTSGTHAINCYVCHSVNGSDPNCEAGGESAKSHLQMNCLSKIGSVDGRTPVKANACMMMIGEYRDKQKNQLHYMVSRQCTAGIQTWTEAKSINCEQFDSLDHLPGDNQIITGCAEPCMTDQCNGDGTKTLITKYRPTMKEHIEKKQSQNPKQITRFPSIFQIEENARLQDTTVNPQGTGTSTATKPSWTWSTGSSVIFALVFSILFLTS